MTSADAAPVLLCLLGQPRLVFPEGRVHVLERRMAVLLAVLALQGPCTRDAAIALLWPRATRAAGQNSLRQRLFRLRVIARRRLIGPGPVLALAPGTAHDISRHDAIDAEEELLATLEYGDEPELADWVQQQRQRWRQRRVAALTSAAEAHEAAGELNAALVCVQRALQASPGCESAHAQHMRLHYLRGDRAAALQAWSACGPALRQHIGAEPGAQTQALAALIQSSGPLPLAPAAAAQHRAPPLAWRRPPRLVGRDAEWRLLQQAQQCGQGVLVCGEPGIGKTRLLADFTSALEPPCGHHCGRPGDAGQPFSTLQRLLPVAGVKADELPAWARRELARLVPDWGAAAAGQPQLLRLQRALALALQQLRAAGQALLVVDDFQFVDHQSQDLLLACLDPADPALPLPWLGVRAGELPDSLRRWLAQRAPDSLLELPLAPLDEPAVVDFVTSLGLAEAAARDAADWAAVLLRRTGGNPLFMLQLVLVSGGQLAQAFTAVPGELLRLLQQRLSALPQTAMRVLQVLALVAPPADAALVASVLGVHVLGLSAAYAELLAAGLLHDNGSFAYDAIEEAARASVPAAVAAPLHAALAQALQLRAAPPAVVAEHHQAAGQWAAAATCLEAAAQQARAGSTRSVEMRLHDRAAQAHRRAGNAAAAWQAAHCALACAHTEEPSPLLQARSAALLADATTELQRLVALLHGARLRLSGADGVGAAALTAEALPLAGTVGSTAQRLTAQGWHGLALAMAGQPAEGLQVLLAAAPAAHAESDARARLDFFGSLGYALHVVGRFAEAIAPLRLAAETALALGEWGDALEQNANLAVCCSSIGDRAGEIAAVDATLAAWQRLGRPESLAADTVLVQACTSLIGHGRYAEALALLPALEDRLARNGPGHWAVIAGHRLALLYLRLGQPARRARRCGRCRPTPLPAPARRGCWRSPVLTPAAAGAPTVPCARP